MEGEVAGGSGASSQVYGEGPSPLPPLLRLSQGTVEEDSHHQHVGAGFQGGKAKNKAHGRLS